MERSMNSPKSVALILGVFLLSGLMAACGKSGGDGGASTPAPPPVAPCTSGCPSIIPPNSKIGFYAQTQNFYLPGYMNSGSSLQLNGGMTSVLRDAMGVCDRLQGAGWQGGLAACSAWLSGAHDMVLYSESGTTSNTVKLIIRSVPGTQFGGQGWYSYSVPNFKNFLFSMLGAQVGYTGGVFDPLVLQATIWPINNSQGFEVRTYGPRASSAWNKLFQLQVASGKLEDPQWNFQLHFNGQKAMSGTAIRCQSQNCGLDSSFFNTVQ